MFNGCAEVRQVIDRGLSFSHYTVKLYKHLQSCAPCTEYRSTRAGRQEERWHSLNPRGLGQIRQLVLAHPGKCGVCGGYAAKHGLKAWGEAADDLVDRLLRDLVAGTTKKPFVGNTEFHLANLVGKLHKRINRK